MKNLLVFVVDKFTFLDEELALECARANNTEMYKINFDNFVSIEGIIESALEKTSKKTFGSVAEAYFNTRTLNHLYALIGDSAEDHSLVDGMSVGEIIKKVNSCGLRMIQSIPGWGEISTQQLVYFVENHGYKIRY